MTAAEKIKEMGIVPVVVLEDAMDAKPLAKALCEGGLPCAEVTFRTAAAKESIRIMLEEYPEMFVGAGTVLTTRQVDEAIEAGAKFIVSPGLDPEIVDYCIEKQIPVFPGCDGIGAGAGGKTGTGSGQILPGRDFWRAGSDQSTGSSICGNEIYADRWYQSEKCPFLSGK